MFARSRDWNTFLPLRKNLSTLHFQFCWFLKNMSLIVLDMELTGKKIKELVLYINGSLQGFSFCPPKTRKPNKQTIWNTSLLHGIAWSSGKLDYDKLFAVFYDIEVLNEEMFAEGLEKCRMLTRLLGKNLKTLDDYGCQKIQDFVGEEKRTVRGSALVTFSDTKQGFTGPRGKRRCLENGLSNICKILHVFIVFVSPTNLILSTRHNCF